jgi:hypothetical protein
VMVELDKASKGSVTLDPRDTSKGIVAMTGETLKSIAATERAAAARAKANREETQAEADARELEQAETLAAIRARMLL